MGVKGIAKTSRLRGWMSIPGAAAAGDTAGKTRGPHCHGFGGSFL